MVTENAPNELADHTSFWQWKSEYIIRYSEPQSTKGKHTRVERRMYQMDRASQMLFADGEWADEMWYEIFTWPDNDHTNTSELKNRWSAKYKGTKNTEPSRGQALHWVSSPCIHDRNNHLHISQTNHLSLFATFFYQKLQFYFQHVHSAWFLSLLRSLDIGLRF